MFGLRGNNIWPFPRTKKSKQLHQSYFGSYEELHHLFLQVSKFHKFCKSITITTTSKMAKALI
ncbi:hypothetical protein CN291_05510 [Bacillus cereus]|nr:hypothetical protein CON28_09410 [Bacillus cereus]PFB69319.1 hypothetical protein CN291_05510 [Bacillus cereus]